jgi:SAM-dependent methyltransferase
MYRRCCLRWMPEKLSLTREAEMAAIHYYLARKYSRAKVIGIELKVELIENCRTIASRLKLRNLSFVQGDLAAYRPMNYFDLICCIDVLEHIEDDEKVLSIFHGALRENGELLLHVPVRGHLQKHYFRDCAAMTTEDHVRDGYYQEEIVAKLRTSGFAIKELRYTFGWFGSLSSELSRKLERAGPWRTLLKLFLFPLLITLAYLDTLSPNHDHQGFLLRASLAK